MAGDVALIHVASMSNLFAALGWALVDLLAHPDAAARVVAGDRAWAEACTLESIRLAQRSIMSRYVLSPVNLDVGDAVFEIPPATTVATLLPLTNTSSGPGLTEWDPTRWRGRRLADTSTLAAIELVTDLRPRTPYLSGPALLAGRHDGIADQASVRLRVRRRLDRTAPTGSDPDRWCGPSQRCVSDGLPAGRQLIGLAPKGLARSGGTFSRTL